MMVCASVATAANKEGQFSITPVVGGYSYDAGQHLDTTMVYGARGGYNITKNFTVEALFDYVQTEPTRSKDIVDMYRYGGELLYHFFPDNKFVPYVAVGFAGLNFDSNLLNRRTYAAYDAGAGFKYYLNDKFALRFDARGIFYQIPANWARYVNSNAEYTVGAYIPFGGSKPAAKPVEAPAPKVEPAPAPVAAPAPSAPTASLTAVPASITKGQSTTLNWNSKNATKCDIQPDVGSVAPNGARAVSPAKNISYVLTCTGDGGKATSSADVAVALPVAQQKAVERFCSKPAVLDIHFDVNKADIKPKYEADLKTVGAFLKEFPKAKGEISGHTDSTASREYNQKLSEKRAANVGNYIIKNFGIEAGRITTKGYGETKPVADNKTKEGRAQNRRIESNFTCE
jgi:OOP family OmpA-OmpF porin